MALLRALDIEAGFVEVPLDIGVLAVLTPQARRALMRTQVKHNFAAAKRSGRWHPADASLCDSSCMLFTEAAPYPRAMVPACFEEGLTFHPVAHIHTEMGKKSCFLPRHFEAMNTRLGHTWRSMPPAHAAPHPTHAARCT
ncbi:hypothetical protein [Hydrogenophaga sp.]|uniref:hypothetical protein n=1 Tax=Hydrogenophaga sp. TaxID=1904254 RepID=UPI003F6A921F